MDVFCSALIVGIGISSAAIIHRMFRELPSRKHLRRCYQTMEPSILFTDSGDAIAVFPKGPLEMSLELAAMRSVDSLLQDGD